MLRLGRILFFVLPVGGSALLILLALYGERSELAANGLLTCLMIPAEIRALDLPAPCDEVYYARAFISCGGVCGTSYRITYSTTASQQMLSTYIAEQHFSPKMHITHQSASKDRYAQGCAPAMLLINSDERDLP